MYFVEIGLPVVPSAVQEEAIKELVCRRPFVSERVRRLRMNVHLEILAFIQEAMLVEELTHATIRKLFDRIKGSMDSLCQLCYNSWDTVREELMKQGLEELLDIYPGVRA